MNMFSRNPFSRDGRLSRSDDDDPAGRLGELAQHPWIQQFGLRLVTSRSNTVRATLAAAPTAKPRMFHSARYRTSPL
jgi:hypothetical protein